MTKKKELKLHPVFGFLLKLAIAVASFYFIYLELFEKRDIETVFSNISQMISGTDWFLLVLTFLMVFDNWGMEAIKWRGVAGILEPTSLLRSYKAVFSGVTIGMFAPNRIGEFGGKVLWLKPENRAKGVLAAFLTGWAQLLITLTFGAFSLTFFLRGNIDWFSQLPTVSYSILCILALAIPALLIYIYVNISTKWQFLTKIGLPKRFIKWVNFLSVFHPALLASLLLVSLFRYFIFFLQYFILLYVFDTGISFGQLMVLLPVAYVAMSFVPSIFIAEVGVRSSLAIAFLGLVSSNTEGIFAASVVIWAMNIAVPAATGAFFILSHKTRKNKLHD
ncbi:MAG: flippase-like domain-containing protein [Bacteroidetes bacterium]|nr:flippase-like domain-containing protein [Bacteroidota bacterium]MBU1718928.1 flippase-like domain-containing protein [Bacteroidota bacterium]